MSTMMSTTTTRLSLTISGVALALATAGCFGSDPNKNSMLAGGGDASTPVGPITDASIGITGTPLATFDTTLQGFVLNAYHELPTSGQINLGDPNSGLAMATEPELDSAVGSPTPGSLMVSAPFTGAKQYVDIQNTTTFGVTNPQNWTGGTMHVRVKADGADFIGVAQPYVDTGTGYVFGGQSTNYMKGNQWQEFTVNIDHPTNPTTPNPGFDPTKVIAIGIQLNSGSAGQKQQPLTFHIDSFSIAGVTAPTGGGSGGAGGGTAGSAGAGGGHAGASGHADAATD